MPLDTGHPTPRGHPQLSGNDAGVIATLRTAGDGATAATAQPLLKPRISPAMHLVVLLQQKPGQVIVVLASNAGD